MSVPGVTVIIPTWNRADLIRGVLTTLRGQTAAPEQILVVDNGSEDATASAAQEGGAELLAMGRNAGFAAAVNAGAARAAGEWLFILNNDVELEPEWLALALQAAESDEAGFVTGKLLQTRAPVLLDGTWDLLSRAGCAWRCGWNAPDGPAWDQSRRIAIAPLTAALFHRDVFRRVGPLDTRFESYYEDVDFGVRCALAGIHGVYEPRAVGRHLGSATLGGDARMTYLVSRNQVLLAAKYELSRAAWWPVFAGQAAALLPALRQGRLWAALRGKRDGLRLARRYASEPVDAGKLAALLELQERELREFQERIGFDFSWKLYFAATGR